MSSGPRFVFCVVREATVAKRIVAELKQDGYSSAEISVMLRQGSSVRSISGETAAEMAGGSPATSATDQETLVPEGVAVGAGAGGLLGGALGWLAGIGSLAIPGIGPLLATGTLFAALSGAAVGAVLGGSAGMLVGLGLSEVDSRLYQERIMSGGVIVSVEGKTPDRLQIAREIFERHGAENIITTETAPARVQG